ncbi:hypothetical protein [Alcaligenes sp. SDU_A2]|uniref:hypothetical protein n=1 Tax=Alcaligenes sp. SDU_A2 TaxID=3136634 RepID=UPI002B6EF510|nr:hypothetical protein [Alcaligenes sp.]HRL28059.1 hypothetical protein [Alcaligenes sp.]
MIRLNTSPAPRRIHPYLGSILALLAAVLFAAAAYWDRFLTAQMSLHMLVHIPLLVLSGIVLQLALSFQGAGRGKIMQALLRPYYALNEYGLPGLILVSFAAAYWMVPKSLDDVLVSSSMAVGKYVGLVLMGMLFMESWRRAHLVFRLFFLGNFCWMMGIVGILYQENPMRLCNFYLQSDQEIAGIGLVVMACVLPLFWLLAEIKAVMAFLRQ